MCDRWLESFENFLADMGERPAGTSLDRIDVNGNYEPGNCRWATAREQAGNMRTTRKLTIGSITQSVSEWARLSGGSASGIFTRLKKGLSPEQAVFPKAITAAERMSMYATRSITTIPLRVSVLCVNCETISNSPTQFCPACGCGPLQNLSRVLDRSDSPAAIELEVAHA